MENEEAVDYRLFWNNPWLISLLPKEQRKKVSEKFFELVEKGKDGNSRRMSMIMKERNKRLPLSYK